jgi:hypothetical protein
MNRHFAKVQHDVGYVGSIAEKLHMPLLGQKESELPRHFRGSERRQASQHRHAAT